MFRTNYLARFAAFSSTAGGGVGVPAPLEAADLGLAMVLLYCPRVRSRRFAYDHISKQDHPVINLDRHAPPNPTNRLNLRLGNVIRICTTTVAAGLFPGW